ncbi:MAG: shikimate kinase [candidate division Zixibacteria bacterium]|nr:shikimate kinase [candidate division Zixibacteria bacterium]MCI0596720.1 shikimate kinase [candidate division Zixibacteria bacterium]
MEKLEGKNIYLCGFMGSGKSSVAKRLAARLGWSYVDIDREVEKMENKKISDIFAARGEAYFRSREEEMIGWASRSERKVVSLGGGALLSEKNRAKIAESGLLIWLSASPPVLLERLTKSYLRPLVRPEWLEDGKPSQTFLDFLAEREKEYRNARISVATDGKSSEQAADEIHRRLKEKFDDA